MIMFIKICAVVITFLCFYFAFRKGIFLRELEWEKWKAILFTDRNVKFNGIDWFIGGLFCLPATVGLLFFV